MRVTPTHPRHVRARRRACSSPPRRHRPTSPPPRRPPGRRRRSRPRSATGGAVSTVDPEASAAALKVLKKGGNAADAAVAAAATLGVTEPYSAGIGGGGYFVYYDAKTGQGQHHRRPRDRAGEDAHRRLHRPGDRQALHLHPRAGDQRRRRRRPRHPGHLGARPQALRHAVDGQGAQAGHRGRASAASSSTTRSASRRWTTRSASTPSGPAASCSSPAATRPRSARSSATRARDDVRDARQGGPRRVLRGQAGQADGRRSCATRAPRQSTELPVPPGLPLPQGPQELQGAQPEAEPQSATAATTSTAWTRPRQGGTTVGEALNILERYRPLREDADPGAAPLPRGQRAGLRRPRQVRRRPGASWTSRSASCSATGTPPSGPARSARPRAGQADRGR